MLGKGFAARGREARLAQWSREFRNLAVAITGVMIKLGQFIGARADVLPAAITDQLADLHDEVKPERWQDILAVIEQELGPVEAVFAWISETPEGAASIGQVHRAQLLNGERVVIKVQRPGIEQVVRTDLAALDVVARIAMRWQFIARRMDLPLLLDEFARVLWEELDYIHEAKNAALFAQNFADDPGVYVPFTYPEHTTVQVLVMEDVTAIKISDYAAIETAGISRAVVAQRLLDTYMRQGFEHRFFHADPHPGNLFVYPLPPAGDDHPFYLIFVDFGMAGHLTPQIVEGIRETMVSLFTQDVHRMVQSFDRLGVILPGADLDRIEEAMQSVFDRLWGMDMTKMVDVAYADVEQIARDFGDVMAEMPFQVPQDFVYLVRAAGILSGMCTALDPQFNPWAGIAPYAQKLLVEDQNGAGQNLARTVTAEITDLATLALRLPRRADIVMQKLERGDLRMQVRPTRDLKYQLDRMETALNQAALAVVFGSVLLASVLMYTGGEPGCGSVGFVVAGVLLVILLWRGRPTPFG
ncbi:MAG: AarF/ABC1/UbiB kinase family protein [Anaerolineae bacterium]|nr:AarF/ABC1/UbiB kinase family protein [Anaerolineae bacterium]